MKLIIDIPEETYNAVIGDEWIDSEYIYNIINLIQNGIPLPKGHGRLIDVKDLIDRLCTNDASEFFGSVTCGEIIDFVDGSMTIIEADKESEDTK